MALIPTLGLKLYFHKQRLEIDDKEAQTEHRVYDISKKTSAKIRDDMWKHSAKNLK